LDLIGQRLAEGTQWSEHPLSLFEGTAIDGREKQDRQAIGHLDEPGLDRQLIGGRCDELAIIAQYRSGLVQRIEQQTGQHRRDGMEAILA
jgi:hypothetical protein